MRNNHDKSYIIIHNLFIFNFILIQIYFLLGFVCKNYFCDKYMEDGCQNINGRLDKLEGNEILQLNILN